MSKRNAIPNRKHSLSQIVAKRANGEDMTRADAPEAESLGKDFWKSARVVKPKKLTGNTAVVGSRGQITIPSALRKRYGLNAGTTVVFLEDSGRLILEPRNYEALFALQGKLSHLPLEEELQAMRAEERKREDRHRPELDALTALVGTWTFGGADTFVKKQRKRRTKP